ncbi:hypothetical protein Sliba_09090 [Streptomyces nigrescens]|uniref:Thiolase N-terminal domain-containing protein n=1 Tax=Streptomyces nigrescens TaxID=1920 RepID=A0A640TDV9_STRNI|nr:hypothetical protein Sliba_09090 [Streptomyces libani subsp. libani]GGV87072.1 hypothetical protein GCM10010500_06530 [Streptomyces libani subsp. libani]
MIDGFASAGLGTLAPVEVAEYLGLHPTWVDSTAVGGATWEVLAAHAADAITAGHANAVLLVYGSTARADIKAKRRTSNLSFGARGPLQFEVPYGHTLIAKYAMAARRHMHQYGTTLEQLAQVAVQARANAAGRPPATRGCGAVPAGRGGTPAPRRGRPRTARSGRPTARCPGKHRCSTSTPAVGGPHPCPV